MDNVVWLTRRAGSGADPLSLTRRVMVSARLRLDCDEEEFARLLQAALPHRTITAPIIRSWEQKPPPPPGDVLAVAIGLLGRDLAVEAAGDGDVDATDQGMRDASLSSSRLLVAADVDSERLAAVDDGDCRVDRRFVEDLAVLTREYWCLYHTMAPRVLQPSVDVHFQRLRRLLQCPLPGDVQRSLTALAGETTMLDGWLSFLLDDRRAARERWAFAEDLAHEASDHQLQAHVLIARSSLVSTLPHGRWEALSRMAVDLLEAAEALAPDWSEGQAWLLSRQAEEQAALGDAKACARALAAAETRMDGIVDASCLPGPRTQLDWNGFRGNCALLLGSYRDAAEVLRRTADDAGPERATMRAVLLNDLGGALARIGELEAACAAFMESVGLGDETGATVHVQRVAGAVGSLERQGARGAKHASLPARYLARWRSLPAVATLNERLRRLA